MARFVIFAVGLVLALAFSFVACSSDEIQSDIKIVPDMKKYLQENPGLKVQPLIKRVKVVGPSYAKILYSIGYRVAGEAFLFWI